MGDYFQGKKILVIGGTGLVGSEIVRQLIKQNPRVIRIFSRSDTAQVTLQEELGDLDNLRFLIGDIRDKKRLSKALEDIDIVFHVAGLKYTHLSEYNPFEAVLTNVIGTQNLIEAALEKEVEKVILVSMDKAANPASTLGATKLLAEKLMIAAYYHKGRRRTLFSSVRLGTLFSGYKGSIINSLKNQVKKGDTVSITDVNITRFMMPVNEAVSKILIVTEKMQGGETYVLKMPSFKLGDLVEIVIEETCKKFGKDFNSIKIIKTGLKPGEKTDELLITQEEGKNTVDIGDMFVVLSPLMVYDMNKTNCNALNSFFGEEYSSKNQSFLSKEEIRRVINEQNLI